MAAAFIIDFGFVGGKTATSAVKGSVFLTILWTLFAVLFGFIIQSQIGEEKSHEFFAGYILERALSFDNIFVFVLVFEYFAVKQTNQNRILVYGIILALALRAIFIFAGAGLIESFHWILYIFGAFLIYTGIKLSFSNADDNVDHDNNKIVILCKKFLPLDLQYAGSKMTNIINGKRYFTTAFIVILVIATSDIIFALDSIPAVFAVTTDPFIVITANVFSLMGLKAIFFIISDIIKRFHYLKVALSVILIFIGIKMFIDRFMHITAGESLMFIGVVLLVAVFASVNRNYRLSCKK